MDILDEMIAEYVQKIEAIQQHVTALIAQPTPTIYERELLFATLRQQQQMQHNYSIALDTLRAARNRLAAARGVTIPAFAAVA